MTHVSLSNDERELIDLATAAGSDPYDAELALVQLAVSLYHREVADALVGEDPDPVSQRDFTVDGTGAHGLHRLLALDAVARAMGAETLAEGRVGSPRPVIHAVAHESTLSNLAVLFAVMVTKMEPLARERSRLMGRTRPGERGTRTRARREFMVSFGEGVASRLQVYRLHDLEQSRSTRRRLLVARTLAVRDEFRRLYPNTEDARPTTRHRYDARSVAVPESRHP